MNDAIREAFDVIAADAPSTGRIRAALASRSRQHRQRRLMLQVAGAGAAVTAVGGGALGVRRLLDSDAPPLPDIAGGPGGGWLAVPLRYHPAWLPARFGQSDLSVLVAGAEALVVSRSWQKASGPGDRYTPTVALTVGWHDHLDLYRETRDGGTADVDGVRGQVRLLADTGLDLVWQPPGAPRLTVTVLGEGDPDTLRADAVRIARSVRPDARRGFVGPRFGWLPEDLAPRPWQFTVGYTGNTWREAVTMQQADARELQITISPESQDVLVNRDEADQVQINGLTGWADRDNEGLLFPTPDGASVYLRLSANPFPTRSPGQPPDLRSELVAIAENFDVGPWPDLSWAGTR